MWLALSTGYIIDSSTVASFNIWALVQQGICFCYLTKLQFLGCSLDTKTCLNSQYKLAYYYAWPIWLASDRPIYICCLLRIRVMRNIGRDFRVHISWNSIRVSFHTFIRNLSVSSVCSFIHWRNHFRGAWKFMISGWKSWHIELQNWERARQIQASFVFM